MSRGPTRKAEPMNQPSSAGMKRSLGTWALLIVVWAVGLVVWAAYIVMGLYLVLGRSSGDMPRP